MKKVLLVAPLGENFKISDGGYSTASNGILSVLMRMKNENLLEKVDYININSPIGNNLNNDYDVVLLNLNPNSFLNPQVKMLISNITKNIPKRYMHIVWETDPLPKSWNFIWNTDLFTGFFTPSHFVEELIKRNTNKPIHFLPHYIDTSVYSQINIEDKVKENLFSVLFVGQHTKRKGLEDAIISFARALGNKKDAQLILKWHALSNNELPVDVLINYNIKTNVNTWSAGIYTLTDKLDLTQMVNLYKSSSILLMPTRGEGFGLPLIEAMSVGIPVICTNWSSCPEILEDTVGNKKIEYTIDSSINMAHCGYELDSVYALPSIKSIKEALRTKYNQWLVSKKDYYEEVTPNRKIVENKYGYEAIKNHLLMMIEA